MTLDITKFNATVEAAKAKTNDKRWLAAIEKAQAGVVSGWWIVTELAHCYAITTEEGHTYFANGECQCEAYRRNQPCKHRALARMLEIYRERETAPFADVETSAAIAGPEAGDFRADVAASSRTNLIAEIENIWPRFAPGLPLYTELLARYGKSHLDMLDDDSLRRVRLAIAG